MVLLQPPSNQLQASSIPEVMEACRIEGLNSKPRRWTDPEFHLSIKELLFAFMTIRKNMSCSPEWVTFNPLPRQC